jgi:hypothetical protein
MEQGKAAVLAELRQIPGVGKSIAEDLWSLEIRSVADLKGRDPEELYFEYCARAGAVVDRCLLYVFREAVYYASTEEPDPELLKWWNWKYHGPGTDQVKGRDSRLDGRATETKQDSYGA